MSNSIHVPDARAAGRLVSIAFALMLVTGCGLASLEPDEARFRGDGAKVQSDDATAKKADPAPAAAEPTNDQGDPEPVTPALPNGADAVPASSSAADRPDATSGDKPAPEKPAPDEPADDPTKTSFVRDVQPILTLKCAECHHAGSPHTSFASYPFRAGDMKAYVAALLVDAKPDAARMPPKPREPLTAPEYDVLVKWAADGLRR